MLGLMDYQRALSAAVIDTTPGDGARLLQGLSARGIAVTGHVRRSWCMGRARRAVPLTLSALPVELGEAILADWVAAGRGTNSFFETEAIDLIDFIAARIWEGTHAMSLACFERAIIRARHATRMAAPACPLKPADVVVRAFGADLVTLEAPIGDLLDAIEGKTPWPELGGETHRLLIAPGIDGLAREASAREGEFWDATRGGVFANRDLATASALVDCGALIVLAPPSG